MKRFALLVLAMILCHSAFAALRGTASYQSAANETSFSVPLTGITGLASGDWLVVEVGVSFTSPGTITYPAGFAVIGSLTGMEILAGPADIYEMAPEAMQISGTPPSSLSFTGSRSSLYAVSVWAFSGRSSSPFVVTPVSTGPVASGNFSPLAFSITGLTPGIGDDVVVFELPGAVNASSSPSFTAPSGWTNQLSNVTAIAASPLQASYTIINSSGTATGTIGGTFTWSGGSPLGYGGYVVSLASAGGGSSCTHSGYTSAGAIATPNGTSGSYLGKTGAFVTPDCSTVNYWQPALGNFGVN